MTGDLYQPKGAARELFRCRAPEVLIEGPAGTGKTRALLELVNIRAEKYPGSRHLLLRKTRASMTETILNTFENKGVLCPGHPAKEGPQRSHREAYKYPNGSVVVCGGMDKPDKLFSSEFDTITAFEATELTLTEWESLGRALRNRAIWRDGKVFSQALADCNPSYPGHWLNVRANDGLMHRLRSRHVDNPSIEPEELERLSKLTGHLRARLYLGVWQSAEGVVYDRFDPDIHVRDREPPLDGWPGGYVIGVDDGVTNPMAVVVCGIDNDGRIHVEREVYRSGLLMHNKVSLVESCPRGTVVVDPSAADLKLALRNAGLDVVDGRNDVLDGIQRLSGRLECALDGKPRLTVSPDCTNLISEFETYRWKEYRDGALRDEVEKRHDHAMDALRYAVSEIDKTGTAGVLLATDGGESASVGDLGDQDPGPEEWWE